MLISELRPDDLYPALRYSEGVAARDDYPFCRALRWRGFSERASFLMRQGTSASVWSFGMLPPAYSPGSSSVIRACCAE